ncbi:MAG: translocase [Rhodospirillaceae bacterium]|nr:translocase [Rhodospirillaceae bacterium]
MGNNFQFLEIIFFAMVAIFIILRLRNVLGRRTGNEPTNTNNFKDHKSSKSNDVSNVVSIGENNFDEKSSKPKNKDPDIYEIDPTFDEGEFLQGASTAYEMILTSFATVDFDTLRALLDDDVYNDFYKAIEERNEREEHLETTIVSINSKEIIESNINDSVIDLTVKFSSEVINTIRDKDGELISEGSHGPDNIIDIWTFSRDTRSNDLNWKLIATQSEN